MNSPPKSPFRVLIIVFGLIGAATLSGALFAAYSTLSFRYDSVQARGTVVELSRSRGSKGRSSYKPVVEYSDASGNVHRVTGSIGSNPAAYDIGEDAPVRYRSEHPDDARIDSFKENWFLTCLLGGLGGVFGGVSGGILLAGVLQRRQREWLELNGTRVQAKVIGVELNRNLRINGRSPWRINAQWQHPMTKAVHIFRSQNLWFDPTPYVTMDSVNVRVDADRPKRHWMDVSFLPRGE